MRLHAHIMVGVLLALLGFELTHDVAIAAVLFFGHVLLTLDLLFKRGTHFEPMHSLLGMFITWLPVHFYAPTFSVAYIIAYGTHLFTDFFYYDEMPILFPMDPCRTIPVKGFERAVMIGSAIGIAALVVGWMLR